MLFSAIMLVCAFVLAMRVLGWLARHHPWSRNAAAFVLEFIAAYYVAMCFALSSSTFHGALADNLGLATIHWIVVAAGAHFLAHTTAKSPYALFAAFGMAAVAVALGLTPQASPLLGATALLALGALIGWAKYRLSAQKESPSASSSAAA
jgi:hypothetical protein